MSTARPVVAELDAQTGKKTEKTIALPDVFTAPIRTDVIAVVHRDMAKNRRQAHGISPLVGIMYSAESWHSGRAVARIPRVNGGGTHRSGQAAFGNMTRGGHMYSPKTTYRRWHRRVSVNMRRYAIVSALAASAVPALVMARGHRIEKVPEVPLVLSAESAAKIKKTKDAIACLKAIGAYDDVERAAKSRQLRAGKGKLRNRRHTMRRGPLVIYNDNKSGLTHAFRNVPGVDLCKVTRLSILKLAPGAHVGRFIIWTADAFEALDKIYGTYETPRKGFELPRAKMANTDLARIMHSEAVKAVIKPAHHGKHSYVRRNPLRNLRALAKLNPRAIAQRRSDILIQRMKAGLVKPAERKLKEQKEKKCCCKKARIQAKKATRKEIRAQHKKYVEALLA